MFKKLVANLPFNPSLISQVGFYADRLRQEKSIRRMSFVFMALAMAIQSIAIISPPERSLAYSTNHILNGVRTRQDILSAYDNPNSDIKDIYSHFNLTRADLEALPSEPNVTIRSNDGSDWWTTGRSSLWNYSKVNEIYKRSEIPVKYRGSATPSTSDDAYVYARQLRAWDIVNPYNTYKAFKGKSSATGQEFWILVDCGNITWKDTWKTPPPPVPEDPPPPPPVPEPAKPKLRIRKSITGTQATVKPGDSFTYRIEYQNTIEGSVAENVVIRDELDVKNFDVISPKNLNISASGVLLHSVGDVKGAETYYFDIVVKLKNPLPSGTRVCNGARLEADNASPVDTDADVCIDVVTPCRYDPSIPNTNNPNCVEPVVVCKIVDSALNRTTREVTYKTTVTSSNPATTEVYGYNYDFGDGSETLTNLAQGFTDTASHTYAPGSYEAKVTIVYGVEGVEGKQQAECTAKINFEEDQPLSQSKTVSNITRGLKGDDAIKSSVRAGEVLEYTLTTVNTQNYERVGVEVADYIGDILDYATLDLEQLKAEGGTFDEEQSKVVWKNLTVPANSQVELKFRVTLLNPIPSTNKPSSTSGDFDCVIDNTYGNIVSMSVQCPAVKGLETIPNTGPGTSLLASVGLTAIVGYFFARARLLSKELTIIRTDYAATGGM